MFPRPFWINRLYEAWQSVPVAWVAGVRRSGKTTLAQSLGPDSILLIECDQPEAEDTVKSPSLFFKACRKPIVVFDEVHQLKDPSRVLKIGADSFPHLKILATGSSTLAASKKFRDTLTGRKRVVHLPPVLWTELPAFGGVSLQQRLFHGGLPQALLASSKPAAFYREWMDSFFARDIHRLFEFRDLNRFNALLEYLLRQSGGLLDVTKTASAVGISRPTVESHLQALQITQAVTLLRPFHSGGQKEITRMPRLYGFDTGFVSHARGWDPLRSTDLGWLWEHLVLEHLQAYLPDLRIHYWRDKTGREVDFVIVRNRDQVDAIECKWDPTEFDPAGLKAFRSLYPKGNNYLVCPLSIPAYLKQAGTQVVKVCDPSGIAT
jgi:uncharacterized protein